MPDIKQAKQTVTSTIKPIWCPGCLTGDTLIVSNPSVKQIQDVQMGDKVLTAAGNYKKVAARIVHVHKGLMYRIRVKCFGSINATPEHPFVAVKRIRIKGSTPHNTIFNEEKIEASELQKGDYFVFPIMNEVRDTDSFELDYTKKPKDTRSKPLPASVPMNNDMLRLFGYYIAEGSMHSRELIFSFNQNEKELVEDVESIMKEKFMLSSRRRTKEGNEGVDVIFNSSYLSEIFSELFGKSAETKHIPHGFMFLPKEKQAALIRGMWRGNGHFDENKAGYATISVVLAEQLKMLLLRQGIVPIIYTEPAHGIHKKAYRLYVKECSEYNKLAQIVDVPFNRTNSGKNRSSIIKDNRIYLPVSEIEAYPFEGPVYDLTIDDSDHTFVTNITASGNCGDFSVQAALAKALTELGINKSNVVIVSGIGCSSAMPHSYTTYGVHSLHGRLLPVAAGIKLANDKLTVIGTGGDGDGYGIGVGHLIHTARRNIDMTYLVMNNEIYGLTTGQASPTTFVGQKTKSTPFGDIENPINPIALALGAGATYVARAFSGDPMHMAGLIKDAIQHKGFSIIDIFSPCVTFNNFNTYDWYRPRVYKLDQAGHDPTDISKAFEKALEADKTNWDKIPIGLFYKAEKPTYSDLDITLKDGPLIDSPLPDKAKVQGILDEYK